MVGIYYKARGSSQRNILHSVNCYKRQSFLFFITKNSRKGSFSLSFPFIVDLPCIIHFFWLFVLNRKCIKFFAPLFC